MVLELSGHVRNTFSLLYKQFFFIYNFGLFLLKIPFLNPPMFENVIVTSYVDRFS